MFTKVRNYCKENNLFEGCGHVVVGLSGGADSVCLLTVLTALAEEFHYQITAVHVHHGIRGHEADNDLKFCRELCDKTQIPIRVFCFDVLEYARQEGITSEEAGRILRYRAFRQVAEEYADSKVAVAHHRNDQAETLIFQMCRGSGLRGLRGMLPERDGIIRPLLSCDREEILEFLQEGNIPHVVDSTNLLNDYTRNRIRNLIIPQLESHVNNQAVKNMASATEKVAKAQAYIDRQVTKLYDKSVMAESRGMLVKLFPGEDPYLYEGVFQRVMGVMANGMKDIGSSQIQDVTGLMEKPSGTKADIRQGLYAEKNQDGIFFRYPDDREEQSPVDIQVPSEIDLWNQGEVFRFTLKPWAGDEKISNEVYTKCFDYDKIKFGLQLRNRQSGDYIVIDSAGHGKKLKEYFIHEKIPARMREHMILLADGNHIMWVVGGRIGADYRVTESTRQVLIVDYGGNCNGTH